MVHKVFAPAVVLHVRVIGIKHSIVGEDFLLDGSSICDLWSKKEHINKMIPTKTDGTGPTFLPRELPPRTDCRPTAWSVDSTADCNYPIDSFAAVISPFLMMSESGGIENLLT